MPWGRACIDNQLIVGTKCHVSCEDSDVPLLQDVLRVLRHCPRDVVAAQSASMLDPFGALCFISVATQQASEQFAYEKDKAFSKYPMFQWQNALKAESWDSVEAEMKKVDGSISRKSGCID